MFLTIANQLVSQSRSTPWFWQNKCYFRHVFDEFAFAQHSYNHHTSNRPTNGFKCLDLNAQYLCSLQKHLKAVWKSTLHYLFDSPILCNYSFCETSKCTVSWGLARCRFFTKPIISVKVMLPFQRTYLSCTLGKQQDTQRGTHKGEHA